MIAVRLRSGARVAPWRASLVCLAALVLATLTWDPGRADASWVLSDTQLGSLPHADPSGYPSTVVMECPAAGSCIGVGSYSVNSQLSLPMVTTIHDGVASPAIAVELPSGASTVTQNAKLGAIACWSATGCVATGYYKDSDGNGQAMVVRIIDGKPARAVEVTPPSNRSTGLQTVNLPTVSCESGNACVAVGSYTDAVGFELPMVVNLTAGNPAAGVEATLPTDAGSPPQGALGAVGCVGGSCEAAGIYGAPSGEQLMTETVSHGQPGSASSIAAPGDAGADPEPEAGQLECWAAGDCVGTGTFLNQSSNVEPLTFTVKGGVAQQAQDLALPSDDDSSSPAPPALIGLGCLPGGACLATGLYPTDSARYAMAVPFTNGTAQAAVKVTLPGNAALSDQNAALEGVGCSPAAGCLAAGYYRDASGDYAGMIESYNGRSVGTALEDRAPAGERRTDPYRLLESAACGPDGSCAAEGIDTDTANDNVPYVLAATAPVVIRSKSLPVAKQGAKYRVTLDASGAWGAYRWSIVLGKLPKGLRLNGSRGEITGAPVKEGKFRFAIRATGVGAATRPARRSLVITVKRRRG